MLVVYSMQHWHIELSANYKDDNITQRFTFPPPTPACSTPAPPPLGSTMCRCGTSMGQWWRGVESSTAILIPISPTPRQRSVWSLWYCLAALVISARLRLSLSESFWRFLNSTCLIALLMFHLSLFPVWFHLCLLRTGSLNVDWAPLLQLVMSGASLVRGQH